MASLALGTVTLHSMRKPFMPSSGLISLYSALYELVPSASVSLLLFHLVFWKKNPKTNPKMRVYVTSISTESSFCLTAVDAFSSSYLLS